MATRPRGIFWTGSGRVRWRVFANTNLFGATAALLTMTLVSAGPSPADLSPQRVVQRPLGLPPLPQPASDTQTTGRIALGRKLFFDPRLSASGRMSCATCHVPAEAFTQTGRATPLGNASRPLRRNAPTLLNVAFVAPLMRDGSEPSLELQVLAPLFDPAEMANPNFATLTERLQAIPEYQSAFAAVFEGTASLGRIGDAIASYERTLLSANAPFDRWRFGRDENALSPAAKSGYALFNGKAGCSQCHVSAEVGGGILFTDHQMHNTGIGAARSLARSRSSEIADAALDDRGRFEVTQKRDDLFKYRTPSLRNVALTAPYMHDGSLASLADVVDWYDRGGESSLGVDPLIRPLGLSQSEKRELEIFLDSLTGDGLAELIEGATSPAGRDKRRD